MQGVHFAVWAPNAQRVSVIGDFNRWDGRTHLMRRLIPSGVWEIFIPDLADGMPYKYEVRTHAGHLLQKADPFARLFEVPPKSASVIWSDGAYRWGDGDWIQDRESFGGWHDRPMSIYEVHLGSWRRVPEEDYRPLTYRELAATIVPYVREMGYTHIELMPVLEHPFSGSWGYQVIGFFAPTSRFGTPDDFRYFVDECHRHGLGVILDWVPGHFPEGRARPRAFRRHRALRARRSPPGRASRVGHARVQLRTQRGSQLPVQQRAVLAEGISLDGLRVDAVASMLYLDYSRNEGEWIPNQFGGRENLEAVSFLQQLNTLTHGEVARHDHRCGGVDGVAGRQPSRVPGRARVQLQVEHGLDARHAPVRQGRPVHRRWHHNEITFSMLYAFTENFILPFSHDEVVHGKRAMLDKMPGDLWQKHATLRTLYGYMFGHPGKKLMFMGGEFGQWREWNCDESLDWHLLEEPMHAGLARWVQDLNRTYQRERSLHQVDFDGAGFSWIDCNDNENSVISMIRRARDPHDFMRDGGQLHAGAAARLPDRRSRRRLVPGGAQQRRRALRRQQHGERRRRDDRSDRRRTASITRCRSSCRRSGSCCSRNHESEDR